MTQRSKPQIQNKVARLWATGTSKAGVAKRPREGLHKSVIARSAATRRSISASLASKNRLLRCARNDGFGLMQSLLYRPGLAFQGLQFVQRIGIKERQRVVARLVKGHDCQTLLRGPGVYLAPACLCEVHQAGQKIDA